MFSSRLEFCREIISPDEFAGLREDWNRLLSECSYPSAFCTWEWAWEWWQHFGTGAAGYRMVVAFAYRPEGTLIGLAPFFFPNAEAGLLRLRALRPLATRMRCMVDDMTEEPIVLLHRDWTSDALRSLWKALSFWDGRKRWDLVQMRVIRRASEPSLGLLWRQAPGILPFLLTRSSRRLGQTRVLPSTWAKFRQSLGKSMRDNVSYYPRLLSRDNHVWSVRIARSPGEVAEATQTLVRLHGDRAHSGRGPAHLDHLPGAVQKDFLGAVLARLAASGQAAVALLEIEGIPIAAQAVLETEGRMTFYYSGFDPRWHRYSPVTVLHIALLQDAIHRKVRELDYLPEAEPWKTRWGTEAEYVFDELSCLSLHPRALFRSAWRRVIYQMSKQRGSRCECGLCSPQEQQDGMAAARLAAGKRPREKPSVS